MEHTTCGDLDGGVAREGGKGGIEIIWYHSEFVVGATDTGRKSDYLRRSRHVDCCGTILCVWRLPAVRSYFLFISYRRTFHSCRFMFRGARSSREERYTNALIFKSSKFGGMQNIVVIETYRNVQEIFANY